MDEIMAKIQKAAQQEPKSINQQFLKLSEEVGEAAQAYLSATEASGNAYKNKTTADVKEELADVLLVVFAMLHQLDCNGTQLAQLLDAKTDKWLAHQSGAKPEPEPEPEPEP